MFRNVLDRTADEKTTIADYNLLMAITSEHLTKAQLIELDEALRIFGTNNETRDYNRDALEKRNQQCSFQALTIVRPLEMRLQMQTILSHSCI